MPFTLTGGQVRSIRLALGVTQAELARQLGYTRYAVYWWERHKDRSIPRTQYQPVLSALARLRDDRASSAHTLQSLYTSSTA